MCDKTARVGVSFTAFKQTLPKIQLTCSKIFFSPKKKWWKQQQLQQLQQQQQHRQTLHLLLLLICQYRPEIRVVEKKTSSVKTILSFIWCAYNFVNNDDSFRRRCSTRLELVSHEQSLSRGRVDCWLLEDSVRKRVSAWRNPSFTSRKCHHTTTVSCRRHLLNDV